MKVLWFSLSPCGSIRRDNTIKYNQGWMISLEDEIKKHNEIDLSVCYITNKPEDDFIFDGVHYYPVNRRLSSFGIVRILNRFTKTIENEHSYVLPQFLDVVRKVKPDIIHIHGTEQSFGLIQDTVNDIPIVFSIQGLIAPIVEKYFAGYPAEYIRKYDSLLHKLKGVGAMNNYQDYKIRAQREMQYLQNARYIIGRTQFDHFIPRLFNPNVRIYQGEEILRKEFFDVEWNKCQFGKPIKLVTTVSSGVIKGYETILHTASLLKQYADFDFEWQIIGYDSNNQWVHIAEQYKGLNSVHSNIKLLGRKTADEMLDILLQSDIYIQTSHIENSPNSVCEAMLIGMPIIASFAGGTSSMLKGGEEGILVQDGDPYVLGGAIVNMSQDFHNAKQMGEKARQRAIRRHNPMQIGNDLIQNYNDIITDFHNK